MRTVFLLMILAAPLTAADGEKINAAIRNGARFLETQNLREAGHGTGAACLAGLALMEAGTAANSPIIASIQQFVRERSLYENQTYQTALSILFLDRVANPADVGIIQVLGARLMAGQTILGGWQYSTFDNITAEDAARVLVSVRTTPPKGKLNGEASRILLAMAAGARPAAALTGSDDNSNTQFGLIGLWVARRHGLPTDYAFGRLQSKFLRTQSPADGGWGYGNGETSSSPSMTCAGLLGLAAAKASFESGLPVADPTMDDKPKSPEDDDPFQKPPRPGDRKEDEDPQSPAKPRVEPADIAAREKAIERGLLALGKLLTNTPALTAGGAGAGHYGGLDDLYFYWSLERVAVGYGLDTIGGVDWYKWGCDGILPRQNADGSWDGKYASPVISTSFALLFLKKANLTSDLSRRIAGKVKDPGGGELRGGRGAPINTAGTVARRKVDDPKAAAINPVRTTTEADKIAQELVSVPDKDWLSKLKIAKENKGSQYTVGLAQAIAVLEGRRLYQAREALAERLVRMTSDTLKRMLGDRDAEVRRAACLAVGMKDDRERLIDVIDCIEDPNEAVVRAAKATLKALSGADYGPGVAPTEDDKRTAANAWRLWLAQTNRK